jgi:hypothetical protein
MPFTDSYIVLGAAKYKNPLKFLRVYYPTGESAETFEHELYEVLESAKSYALSKQKQKLSDVVIFGISNHENILPSAFKDILQQNGFQQDEDITDLLTITFALSWEVDSRLRTLQERLQKQVYMAHPAEVYDLNELVAQHNAQVLQQALRAIFNVELDLSLQSLRHLDDIVTMRKRDEDWRFHVFTEPFLAACGDYTGEVIRALFPSARWVKQERPLALKGATFAPRGKATKLCFNGIGDSLENFVGVIQGMVDSGSI